MDELTFHPGRPLDTEMFQAIDASDKFVLIATPKTLESQYVRAELHHARKRAAKLAPKDFIHVVSLAPTSALNFLPRYLRTSLCHVAHGKSLNRLLYEVFFGLHGLPVGSLLAEQLKYSQKPDLVMLERSHLLEVVSPKGDTTFTTERAIQNLGASPLTHTNQMNFWAYGKTKHSRPQIKAWLDTGEELTDREVVHRKLRGQDTYTAKFKFVSPVPPYEVVKFRTVRHYPKAFNLKTGDDYTISCDDRGYGLLRVDIIFPRGFAVLTPRVKVETGGKTRSLGKMQALGAEKFTFSVLKAARGERYFFALKARNAAA